MENKSHVPNHQAVAASIYYPNPIEKTLVAVPLLRRRTCRGSWAPAQVRHSDSKWGGHSPWVPVAESHDILCKCVCVCLYIYKYIRAILYIWVYNRINIYHVSLFHQPEKFSYYGIVTPKHHSSEVYVYFWQNHMDVLLNLGGRPWIATLVYNLPRA